MWGVFWGCQQWGGDGKDGRLIIKVLQAALSMKNWGWETLPRGFALSSGQLLPDCSLVLYSSAFSLSVSSSFRQIHYWFGWESSVCPSSSDHRLKLDAQFWFPYKSWLRSTGSLDPIIRVVWERLQMIHSEIVTKRIARRNCEGVKQVATLTPLSRKTRMTSRVKVWKQNSAAQFEKLWLGPDVPSVRQRVPHNMLFKLQPQLTVPNKHLFLLMSWFCCNSGTEKLWCGSGGATSLKFCAVLSWQRSLSIFKTHSNGR